jgi:hypothetical protein
MELQNEFLFLGQPGRPGFLPQSLDLPAFLEGARDNLAEDLAKPYNRQRRDIQ